MLFREGDQILHQHSLRGGEQSALQERPPVRQEFVPAKSEHFRELDIKGGRHYTASQLLAGGFDLRNTAARLAHSGGATTRRHHADPVPQVDRRAAAYLAQLTAGSATQNC
jgi:integrase